MIILYMMIRYRYIYIYYIYIYHIYTCRYITPISSGYKNIHNMIIFLIIYSNHYNDF